MTATAVLPPPVVAPTGPDQCGDTLEERAALLMRGAPWLTIADVAERTGVTAHTLRYYERIGLLDVPRDPVGRRRYTVADVGRVVFITRLRLTAMPIRDMQEYFRLVDEGPGTEAARLAILQRHRDEVITRLTELHAALDVVDFKINLYRGTAAA